MKEDEMPGKTLIIILNIVNPNKCMVYFFVLPFEQPDSRALHRAIENHTHTPTCLGESFISLILFHFNCWQAPWVAFFV